MNFKEKNDIFVRNTKTINNKILDILCIYKKQGRIVKFYQVYDPVIVSFLSNENLLYHIIVATEENQKGIVKLVNSYLLSLPKADKLILVFPNKEELQNIECYIPFVYKSYPEYEILNNG